MSVTSSCIYAGNERPVGRFVRKFILLIAALSMVTGCFTTQQGTLSNQAVGTGAGAAVGAGIGAAFSQGGLAGVLIGAVVGGIIGNIVGKMLDEHEQRKLDEATAKAFVSDTGQATTYSIESKSGSTPTIVAAKATAPPAPRSDGSVCRPIEQTATKNGNTKTETNTFCQAAGSEEIKPAQI